MIKLLTSTSLEESVEIINKYIFNGIFCEETTLYLYQSPSINNYDIKQNYNDVFSGFFISTTQKDPYSELAALCFSHLIETPILNNLGCYMVSQLQKLDSRITYEFKTFMYNPILFISCGNSTVSITFHPKLGIITFKNTTNVSFDYEQKDLTNASNFSTNDMYTIAQILESYFNASEE